MAKKTGELTPLMKQYWDVKTVHADKIVLFRMGDFFELFYEDAILASQILGITLTQRNKKSEDSTPMCGFPHHSLPGYINKLLSVGHKVAICDQIEDPALAKGLVKRAVTRILTPGMVFDSDVLDETTGHFMASFDDTEVAFIDSTTGEYFYYQVPEIEQKIKIIELLPVAEIVFNSSSAQAQVIKSTLQVVRPQVAVTEVKYETSAQNILLKYIESLSQTELLKILKPAEQRFLLDYMKISATTLRHLEIFNNYRNEQNSTLFSAIQKTKTAAGSRLLRQWLLFPLKDLPHILSRQNQIEKFRNNLFELKKIREVLGQMGDIERRLSKIMQPQAHGRDLIALAESTKKGLEALNWAEKIDIQTSLKFQSSETQKAQDPKQAHSKTLQLCDQILQTISPESPLSTKQGFMINLGVFPELDQLISLSTDSQKHMQELESKEKELTGINSLKIRYNNVFGFYIEITHLHKDKVPDRYQRKQTLANAERYCTDELIELERKVLSAQKKRYDLEFQIFEDLKKKILENSDAFIQVAKTSSELDVYSGLAWLSLENNYVKPTFHDSREINLKGSRHPVVEQVLKQKFVANSIEMKSSEVLLLTGPNMAGKSTLMRQVALIILLAQMGSFVPCDQADLPLFDSLYTRIGASDQLSEGLSTFMVEMTETSQMLKQATGKSLLVLDEVGRGTGTFDGMSLAQSLIEYISESIKCHVLFATHYHELSKLENQISFVRNKHMKVVEKSKGEIEFLHILQPGPAGKSYGIKVAELAGLPKSLTKRAEEILEKFENPNTTVSNPAVTRMNSDALTATSNSSSNHQPQPRPEVSLSNLKTQISFFEQESEMIKQKLIEQVRRFNVAESTPIKALNKIVEWKELVEKDLNS